MAKKILSVVLAVAMLMSIFAVGSFAAVDYQQKVEWLIVRGCGSLNATKLTQYKTDDEDVVTRNLQFWSDSVIEAYGKASIQKDWQNLYELMTSEWYLDSYGDELEDYYPKALENKKAVVDVKYTTDVTNAKPGEKITLTVSAKTNFYLKDFAGGVIYDKTKVSFVDGSDKMVAGNFTKTLTQAHYGLFDSGTDKRNLYWPAQYRDNKNGEYDQYEMIKIGAEVDKTKAQSGSITPSQILSDYTPIFQLEFTVKEGATGSVTFFTVSDCSYRVEDIDMDVTPLFSFTRTISPKFTDTLNDVCRYDMTYNCTPATVTLGSVTPTYADYTALDAAIKAFDEAVDAADYTPASWTAYADAVKTGKALPRDILAENQSTVTNCANAITGAKTGLAKNYIVNAEVAGTPVIGADASINVTVTGSPAFIRLAEKNTQNQKTFNRGDAVIVDNKNGTETWTVKVLAAKETTEYEVIAKYYTYAEGTKDVTVNASKDLDLTIHSIVIPDMKSDRAGLPDKTNGGAIRYGRHDIIITTSQDVYKIQFVAGNIAAGGTYTYCTENPSGNTSYVDKDNGERVWTISHVFAMGEWSMPIRTRAESTTFKTTGDNLVARVLY